MIWIVFAAGLAASIFQGIASLFGGGGVSLEELEQALNEAVNEIERRTYLLFHRLLAKDQLDDAQSLVIGLEIQLRQYNIAPTKQRLIDADLASVAAVAATMTGLDLIDSTDNMEAGVGLLGHPLFLVAASMRFFLLDEWVRYRSETDPSMAEQERQVLIGELELAIDRARELEEEWIAWTEGRLRPPRPVKKVITKTPVKIIKFQWYYFFDGEKQPAGKAVIWQTGDSVDKITQGREEAERVYSERRVEELNKVRVGFVNPSRKVRTNWFNALRTLTATIEERYSSIEEAMHAANGVYRPFPESVRSEHPEPEAEQPLSVNGPSVIYSHRLNRTPDPVPSGNR